MNSSLEQTILNFLSTCHPKGKSTQEISRAIGLGRRAVGNILAYLEINRQVKMVEHVWPEDGSITYLWRIT